MRPLDPCNKCLLRPKCSYNCAKEEQYLHSLTFFKILMYLLLLFCIMLGIPLVFIFICAKYSIHPGLLINLMFIMGLPVAGCYIMSKSPPKDAKKTNEPPMY